MNPILYLRLYSLTLIAVDLLWLHAGPVAGAGIITYLFSKELS